MALDLDAPPDSTTAFYFFSPTGVIELGLVVYTVAETSAGMGDLVFELDTVTD